MDSLTLDNVNVAYSCDTDAIYVYTHGENPYVAIEQKRIDGPVWSAVIQKVLNGEEPGEPGEHIIAFGDKRFCIEVHPLDNEGDEDE